MKETECVSVILYSHNLVEPSKSFSTKFHIKDFKMNMYWTIKKAKTVNYQNPKGERVKLK